MCQAPQTFSSSRHNVSFTLTTSHSPLRVHCLASPFFWHLDGSFPDPQLLHAVCTENHHFDNTRICRQLEQKPGFLPLGVRASSLWTKSYGTTSSDNQHSGTWCSGTLLEKRPSPLQFWGHKGYGSPGSCDNSQAIFPTVLFWNSWPFPASFFSNPFLLYSIFAGHNFTTAFFLAKLKICEVIVLGSLLLICNTALAKKSPTAVIAPSQH